MWMRQRLNAVDVCLNSRYGDRRRGDGCDDDDRILVSPGDDD